jgi:hypothetical protein
MAMNPVDAYLATCPPAQAERLAAVRALALAVPGVTEGMDWNMPVFRRGEQWFAMANRAAYISIYLHDGALVAALVAGDPKLKSGKGCLNIPDRAAMPLAALEGAIRQRLGA